MAPRRRINETREANCMVLHITSDKSSGAFKRLPCIQSLIACPARPPRMQQGRARSDHCDVCRRTGGRATLGSDRDWPTACVRGSRSTQLASGVPPAQSVGLMLIYRKARQTSPFRARNTVTTDHRAPSARQRTRACPCGTSGEMRNL